MACDCVFVFVRVMLLLFDVSVRLGSNVLCGGVWSVCCVFLLCACVCVIVFCPSGFIRALM